MSFSFTYNPRKIYLLVVAIWLILFVSLISLIITLDIQRAKTIFNDYANTHFQQANDRVHINESILEGFAAMVSTSSTYDWPRIRGYAQKMLEQYPHIFKFEIVEKVSADKLDSLSEYYRQNFYPDFKVKAFRYESDRQWQAVKKVPYHLLIVFMEPSTPESREVLGLDIGSNEFLMHSLQKSEQEDRMVSTDPFRLVQGHLAYLLQRPIPLPENKELFSVRSSGAQGGFVELVILADTLLKRTVHTLPGMRELLYNSSSSITDSNGYLHLHETPKASWLESRLFPHLSMSRPLDSKSQPFVLLIEQQLGWELISWGKLGLTFSIAIITFGVMIAYARVYFRNEMERAEMTVRLFHLANHDVLTGLANRNLLSDRLNHAISQTARQKGKLAVLFLDLEKFKDVNDKYGHDAGDTILRCVAERLRACVRTGDSIARLGGDEYVLVLENITSKKDIDHIVEKIKMGFEQAFEINYHSIILGISIGVAIYPEDGTDIDTLINHADSSMYEDKHSNY
jgi:diguanylate cyclase (GGDEF)-like protein